MLMDQPDRAHMVEIELKARIADRKAVEAQLASFMRFAGDIDKRDEYWEVSGWNPLAPAAFRFRVRAEPARTTITFKEKTFDGDIEINRESEFSVDNEAVFRKFMEKLEARFVYTKRKIGTRWESAEGLVAEVVEVEPVGLFLEVECVCEQLDSEALDEAKCRLYEVIDRCGIPRANLEPRPYSQMLGY